MATGFGSFCDDFFVEMCVNTQLDLPTQRETVLAFFERIQKQYPQMNHLARRETGELSLEHEQEGQRDQWVSLEIDRVCVGWAEPEDLHQAYRFQANILELLPYMLGISVLDIESLDIAYSMDFDYQGNHDEVIADALLGNSSFSTLLEFPNARTLNFSPSMIVGLSDDNRLQARVAIETRSDNFESRNDKFKTDEPISLYFTVRRYPLANQGWDAVKAFFEQCKLAETIMFEKIIPHFVQPINNAIAQRR